MVTMPLPVRQPLPLPLLLPMGTISPAVQVHTLLPQSPMCQPLVQMDLEMLLPIHKLRDLSGAAADDGSGSPAHVSMR